MSKRCVLGEIKKFQEDAMSHNLDFYKFVLYRPKKYNMTHHTVTTAIKRFFKVVQAQALLQIEKSAGFQVVANLISVIESVSKYELAIIVKKPLGEPMT